MTHTRRGFGLFAGIAPEVIQAAAAATESRGYASFWVNHPGPVDGLGALARAAAVTNRVELGIGVIPLTTREPASIVDGVRQHQLLLERLLLGIGSPNPGALKRVRDGIAALRADLETRVYVAALGPRMCRLGGEAADGIVLNWLTPDYARVSADWIREAATGAGRKVPAVVAYVRAGLGEAARARIEREAANYERVPAYAAHFARMGVRAFDTAIAGDTPGALQAALGRWEGVVDEVVVRAITPDDTEEQLGELVRAAAP